MKIKFSRFKKGFTLIELLVVIAIISLLSSVVVASLNQSRIKAQEAAIKQDLLSIKTQAELSYNKVGDYSQVATEVAPILAHINKNGGTAALYVFKYPYPVTNNRYAVTVKLNSDNTKIWSISDSYGISTWDQSDISQSILLLSEAEAACAVNGGRLPTFEEFEALYLIGEMTNSKGFSSGYYYWSNTVYYYDNTWKLVIERDHGWLSTHHPYYKDFTRCVR